jgi:hypothetical protein
MQLSTLALLAALVPTLALPAPPSSSTQPCQKESEGLVAGIIALNYGQDILKNFHPFTTEAEAIATAANGRPLEFRYLIDMRNAGGLVLNANRGGDGSAYEVKVYADAGFAGGKTFTSCTVDSVQFKPLN